MRFICLFCFVCTHFIWFASVIWALLWWLRVPISFRKELDRLHPPLCLEWLKPVRFYLWNSFFHPKRLCFTSYRRWTFFCWLKVIFPRAFCSVATLARWIHSALLSVFRIAVSAFPVQLSLLLILFWGLGSIAAKSCCLKSSVLQELPWAFHFMSEGRWFLHVVLLPTCLRWTEAIWRSCSVLRWPSPSASVFHCSFSQSRWLRKLTQVTSSVPNFAESISHPMPFVPFLCLLIVFLLFHLDAKVVFSFLLATFPYQQSSYVADHTRWAIC